jgi:hypothetical protein
MIRLFFRFLATLALAGAVGAAIVDGAKSLAAEALRLTPLGTTLITASPKIFTPYFRALAAPDAGAAQHFALWALSTPTAAALAVLAFGLFALSRARESAFDRMAAGR